MRYDSEVAIRLHRIQSALESVAAVLDEREYRLAPISGGRKIDGFVDKFAVALHGTGIEPTTQKPR